SCITSTFIFWLEDASGASRPELRRKTEGLQGITLDPLSLLATQVFRAYFIRPMASMAFALAESMLPALQAASASRTSLAASALPLFPPARDRGAGKSWGLLRGACTSFVLLRGACTSCVLLPGAWTSWVLLRGACTSWVLLRPAWTSFVVARGAWTSCVLLRGAWTSCVLLRGACTSCVLLRGAW